MTRRHPDVSRLHRAWHAWLGQCVAAGFLPRELTREERRAAQRLLLGATGEGSVWTVDPDEARHLIHEIKAMLDDEQPVGRWVWQVAMAQLSEARRVEVEERVAMQSLHGSMSVATAERAAVARLFSA